MYDFTHMWNKKLKVTNEQDQKKSQIQKTVQCLKEGKGKWDQIYGDRNLTLGGEHTM